MITERIAARIAELDTAEKETEQQLIRIRVVIAELHALLIADEPDDWALRDERDMLMSRLGEAHQTITSMEESPTPAS